MRLIDNPLSIAGCLVLADYHASRIDVCNLLYIGLPVFRIFKYGKEL